MAGGAEMVALFLIAIVLGWASTVGAQGPTKDPYVLLMPPENTYYCVTDGEPSCLAKAKTLKDCTPLANALRERLGRDVVCQRLQELQHIDFQFSIPARSALP